MAVTDFSGLTINAPQVGIQISKVTDSSADWASVSNSTYFYDKADKLVHYKDSAGNIQEIFSGSGVTVGTTPSTGTNGRVFFQAGGVVQQDANFTFDNTLKRLTLKAVGTAATDIPFAVQNSAGTRDILQVAGNDVVRYQSGSSLSQIIWQKVTNGSQQLMTNNFSSITVSIDSAAGDLYTTQGVRLGSSAFGLINNGGQDLSVKGADIFGAEYFNLRMYGGTNVGDYKFKTNTNTGAVFFTTSRFDGSNPFVITDAARVGIGTNSPQSRLDVRAQGALSTDIAFRVRNSADTADLISFRGDGSQWIQSVPFIHAGSLTGGTNAAQSLYVGYNSVSLATTGTRNTIIGTGTGTNPSGLNQTAIGHSVNTGGWSTAIAIGAGATLTSNNSCVMGSESYPFSTMSIGTGGIVTSAAAVQNMTFSVGGVANGFTSNTDLSSKFFRIQSQGGSGNGNGAPIQFSVAPSGASGFTANTFVIPFEVRGDAAGLNHYQLSTPRVPSASITDGYIQYSNDITAGNAAPHFRTENGAIVKVYQETTAVGASTLVGGGGTTLTDTDTFDGYTLKQIVKALRNQGLLA